MTKDPQKTIDELKEKLRREEIARQTIEDYADRLETQNLEIQKKTGGLFVSNEDVQRYMTRSGEIVLHLEGGAVRQSLNELKEWCREKGYGPHEYSLCLIMTAISEIASVSDKYDEDAAAGYTGLFRFLATKAIEIRNKAEKEGKDENSRNN